MNRSARVNRFEQLDTALNKNLPLPFCCWQHVKSIADSGVKVIVAGGKAGELYVHYCNKYNLMVIRLMSKFDIRRLCRAIGATALPKLVSWGVGVVVVVVAVYFSAVHHIVSRGI